MHYNLKLLFTFFCACLIKASLASNPIDSLEKVLKKPIHDTERVIILNKLSFQYNRITDTEKSMNACKQALDLSKIIGYKKGQAKALVNIGNVFLYKLEYENAEKNYLAAYAIAKEIKNASIISNCTNNIGEIARIQGNYKKALTYYLETLKIDEAISDKESACGTLNNVGLIYMNIGNYPKAIETFQKGIEISKEINDKFILSSNWLNLGTAYFENRDLVDALSSFQQSLPLCKLLKSSEQECKVLLGIGSVYFDLGKMDEAMSYYRQSLGTAEKCGDLPTVCSCKRKLGLVYEKKGDFEKAVLYATKSLELGLVLGLKPDIKENYYFLTRNYIKLKNVDKALESFKRYEALNGSLLSIESSKQMTEMQTKYESEKKQKENEVLAQKNELLSQQSKIQNLKLKESVYFIFGLAVLSILIVGIAFLLIRQNKMNAQYIKMEMEQKLLRSQMNPHFIFNAMVGIQNYIYKEEPEVAANYLSSVVHLMRSIIDNSKREYVLLDKEISTLHHYLTLQQVRFPGKFNFNIDTDPDIEDTLIPPMMAQPFIENAIVHGIMNKSDGMGMITVKFRIRTGHLIMEIEDNGIGREKAKEFAQKEDQHLSIATNITEERLKILNHKLKYKNSMTIFDLKDDNERPLGTRVTFLFPVTPA